MSNPISALISELIRDANQVSKIGDYEKIRLLDLAIRTIKDARDIVGYHQNPNSRSRDALLDLQTTANLIEYGRANEDRVRDALLGAADMLRTLKILLDASGEATKE